MSGPSDAAARVDLDWQQKLLPFMTRAITVMGLLFFISSSAQLHLMYMELKLDPETALVVADAQSEESRRWNGLVALEHESIVRENQMVNAIILRQTSLLHLGFLTGMALCLVGAVFVLGRLQEGASSLSGEGQSLKFVLNTSSPGIILAVLGSALMLATLYHRYQFNLPDKAVYVTPLQYPIEKPGDSVLQKPVEQLGAVEHEPSDENLSASRVRDSDEEMGDLQPRRSVEKQGEVLLRQFEAQPDLPAQRSGDEPSAPP